MKIKYCNNSGKLEQSTEDEFKLAVMSILDQNIKRDCSHESMEVSICINDPLHFYIKGNVLCLDCESKFGFTGNLSEPIKECIEL